MTGAEALDDQLHGQRTRTVAPAAWHEAVAQARADGFDYFDWLSAVDETDGDATPARGDATPACGDATPAGGEPASAPPVAVVLHLWSTTGREHLLLRTLLPGGALRLATLSDLFAGAGWHERETAEMFGVEFVGAPDPRPLLLPDAFTGHPLRKDFELAARAVKAWPGAHEPAEHGPAAKPPSRRRPAPPAGTGPTDWPAAARTGTATSGGAQPGPAAREIEEQP